MWCSFNANVWKVTFTKVENSGLRIFVVKYWRHFVFVFVWRRLSIRKTWENSVNSSKSSKAPLIASVSRDSLSSITDLSIINILAIFDWKSLSLFSLYFLRIHTQASSHRMFFVFPKRKKISPTKYISANDTENDDIEEGEKKITTKHMKGYINKKHLVAFFRSVCVWFRLFVCNRECNCLIWWTFLASIFHRMFMKIGEDFVWKDRENRFSR